LVGGRAKLPQFGLETSAVVSLDVATFRIRLAGEGTGYIGQLPRI